MEVTRLIGFAPGGALALSGNNNTVFVEVGGYASVNGTNNTLNSKTVVNSNSPEGFGVNYIYVANAEHALSQNMDDQIFGCSAVVFNYSSAPAGGCMGGTNIETVEMPVQLDLFPNPVINEITISVDQATRIENVRVLDIRGALVLEQPGSKSMKINVSTLPLGCIR